MIDRARRLAIGLLVEEQRAVAVRLRETCADDQLNAQARLAWHWLDAVERIFLSSIDKRQDAAAETQWLGTAEGAFRIALRKLCDVEQAIARTAPRPVLDKAAVRR
jgi:hypothetical protein